MSYKQALYDMNKKFEIEQDNLVPLDLFFSEEEYLNKISNEKIEELFDKNDMVSEEIDFDKFECYENINKVLNTLSFIERKVLTYRFGLFGLEDQTLKDIGEIFDINSERVRQIEAKALRKLRHPSRSECLKEFLL